MRAKKV